MSTYMESRPPWILRTWVLFIIVLFMPLLASCGTKAEPQASPELLRYQTFTEGPGSFNQLTAAARNINLTKSSVLSSLEANHQRPDRSMIPVSSWGAADRKNYEAVKTQLAADTKTYNEGAKAFNKRWKDAGSPFAKREQLPAGARTVIIELGIYDDSEKTE